MKVIPPTSMERHISKKGLLIFCVMTKETTKWLMMKMRHTYDGKSGRSEDR